MCIKTESEIRELLKDLPDEPKGLISFMEEGGSFHGIVGWKVNRGRMLSFPILDHHSCSMYHTRLSKDTVVSWHDHNASEEIIICLSGNINILFQDGSQVTLNPAEKIIIQKGVKHMASIGNKPCQIVAITIPKEKYER